MSLTSLKQDNYSRVPLTLETEPGCSFLKASRLAQKANIIYNTCIVSYNLNWTDRA